jgi:hypothetical protein
MFQKPQLQNPGVDRVGSLQRLCRRICPMPLSWLLGGCWQLLVFLGLRLLNSSLCLDLHMASLYVSVSNLPLLSFKRTQVLGSHLEILNLVTFAKTQFPYKVTLGISFWGTQSNPLQSYFITYFENP